MVVGYCDRQTEDHPKKILMSLMGGEVRIGGGGGGGESGIMERELTLFLSCIVSGGWQQQR